MYVILRAYSDLCSQTETTNSIINALNACAIYLEDPDCLFIKIWNKVTGALILDYMRE